MSVSQIDPKSLANDPFISTVIRRKVDQLIRRPEFCGDERQDLEQEFLARVSNAMLRYSVDMGHRNPYVVAVVERYVATLVGHHRARKRSPGKVGSLNVMICDSEVGPTEFAQTISECDRERRLETWRRPQCDLADLRHDLQVETAKLPAQWQTFLQLRSRHSIAEVSRIMGVPRSTLNSWAHRIAESFEQSGLRDYLS